jgi:hypothetical protein
LLPQLEFKASTTATPHRKTSEDAFLLVIEISSQTRQSNVSQYTFSRARGGVTLNEH